MAAAITAATSLAAGDARAAAAPDHVTTERVTVRLVSEHRSIQPGRPIQAGLSFELADHWHVYWQNPGDSGEPPRIDWHLPAGFEAGPIVWPTPERIDVGPIVNYAYEHEVLLPVTIATPAVVDEGDVAQLAADVRWLVCREEECIPGQARLALELPVAATEPLPDERCAPLFARARASPPPERQAFFDIAGDGSIRLTVPGVSLEDGGARVSFFPLDPGVVDHFRAAAESSGRDGFTIALRRGDLAPADLERISGVVAIEEDDGEDAFVVHATASTATTSSAMPLALALALAFGGGLLLNLMPCVFPVLSLKVLGFVEQAHGNRSHIRVHGWTFAAGVVASFWLLAVALLALRAGGEQLGWGFQLQSPVFVALLCAVLLALALSLSGVFEIGLWMTTLGGERAGAHGYAGSFWTGVLATVVATPCTAPLMGPALGYALTQSVPQSLAVFTALAAGMASPYVVLAHAPRALSWLPRPGAWMVTVRQLTAFPLYATVLWLLYVFSRQTGPDAIWRLMVGLLVVALAAWSWGVLQRRGGGRPVARIAAPALAALGLVIGVSAARVPIAATSSSPVAGEFWGEWSPERVAALRSEGHPVFVNFTADWCLSCKVNERTVFSTASVREMFANHGVTALKADWTNEDDRITRTLAEFGREGVPLYVFYPAAAGSKPRVLPQLPTSSALLEAFTAGTQSAGTESTTRKETRG